MQGQKFSDLDVVLRCYSVYVCMLNVLFFFSCWLGINCLFFRFVNKINLINNRKIVFFIIIFSSSSFRILFLCLIHLFKQYVVLSPIIV